MALRVYIGLTIIPVKPGGRTYKLKWPTRDYKILGAALALILSPSLPSPPLPLASSQPEAQQEVGADAQAPDEPQLGPGHRHPAGDRAHRLEPNPFAGVEPKNASRTELETKGHQVITCWDFHSKRLANM